MELDPFFAVTDTIPETNNSNNNVNQEKPESQHGISDNNAYITKESSKETGIDVVKKDDTAPSSENMTSDQHQKTTKSNDQQGQVTISDNDPEQIILNLLMNDYINENECTILRGMHHENNTLKGKISKLKNLLSRSAKAHKDSTTDLSSVKTKLQTAEYTITMLQEKIEMLYKRPTHLDLLADFETNFDRALLSLGEREEQSGGEDPKQKQQAYSNMQQQRQSMDSNTNDGNVDDDEDEEQQEQETDDQLLTNLRTRMEELESHNTNLLQRISKIEQMNTTITEERDIAKSKISTLELDLRLSKLETAKAIQALKDKSIALTEMQLEIDLVTKSSLDAISKSNATLEAAKDIRVSKRHCEELQAKVDALQEWALASTEAKRLVLERAHDLENKLKTLELSHKESIDNLTNDDNVKNIAAPTTTAERRLWSKSSSKVIGAGMAITHCLTLGEDVALADTEVVLLRWKFDVTPMDMDINFAIYKGNITDDNASKGKHASGPEYLVEPRTVHGGAGGEVASAFAIQGACTLEWSNKRSWVRPRAIKFTVDAFAVME